MTVAPGGAALKLAICSRCLIESQFPIADRSKLQLFSLNTPNVPRIKVAVGLEELQILYEAHVGAYIGKGEQFTDAYKSISPNSKIPAIVDLDGPGGKTVRADGAGRNP